MSLSPKRRGPTYSQHHLTPGTLPLPSSDLRSCTHIARLPKYLILSTEPKVYTLRIRNTQRQTDLRKFRLLPSFTDTHTDASQKNNSIQHSHSIYTREHKLSIHFNSQNFSSFDPHQISRCLSLLKLIYSNESTSFYQTQQKKRGI
jgi:hypothetical protein